MIRGPRLSLAWLLPLLAASYPVLAAAASLPPEYRLADLLVAGAIVALAAAAITAMVLRAWPANGDQVHAGIAASLIMLWLMLMPAIVDETKVRSGMGSVLHMRVALPVSAAILVLIVVWLARRRVRAALTARVVTVFVVMLVMVGAVSAYVVWATSERHALRNPGVKALLAPLPEPRTAVPPSDVYVIVLDEYAAADVLRSRFGFDNSAFIDSLRTLGFVVPDDSRSNYSATVYSLSSALNLSYLDRVAEHEGPDSRNEFPLHYLITHNRLVRFFQHLGYRTVLVPSSDFLPTQRMPGIDSIILAPGSRRTPLVPLLSETVWARSVVGYVWARVGFVGGDSPVAERSLRAVEASVSVPGPKFVLAHLMLTHPPYRLNERCGPRRLSWASEGGRHEAYLTQVRCTNAAVLSVVRHILDRPLRRPIIVLTADHGTATLMQGISYVRTVSPAQAAERFGAFIAFYGPDAAHHAATPRTPIGVLSMVLTDWFGAPMPSPGDRSYFVPSREPFIHEPVPDGWLTGTGRVEALRSVALPIGGPIAPRSERGMKR